VKLLRTCSPIQQRLGYVNAVITLTSPDSFTSRETLIGKLFEHVKDKQENWLRNAKSRTGAITAATAGDIVDWVLNLDLLFPSTFTWRPEARVLDNLISDEEYDAFHGDSSHNPLVLSMAGALFHLYKLLKMDGAALVYLVNNLVSREKWTRKEAADYLPKIYKEYGRFLLSAAESSLDYTNAKEFVAIGESMIEGARRGVVGTKELRVTSKLESLVDLGILDKPEDKKDAYVYCRNEFTSRFAQTFSEWSEDGKNLDKSFFQRAAYIYKSEARRASDEEIFEALINNFEPLMAAYGIAGIEEVCLLSGINLFNSQAPRLLEIDRAKEILIEYQKKYQKDIKLHVDPKGRIRYFSVSKEFLAKYIPENNTSELNELLRK